MHVLFFPFPNEIDECWTTEIMTCEILIFCKPFFNDSLSSNPSMIKTRKIQHSLP